MAERRSKRNKEIVDEVKKEPVVKDDFLIGKVANCRKLNVREKDFINANVLCIIDEGSKVRVYPELSNDVWFSVCTEAGIEGFCMKEFIKVG